jgi:RNA polymerase sigma-70 factor (ECF subfamily)
MSSEQGEVTLLLRAMADGDPCAADKLLPLVYHELHRLAESCMRRERADHTLQPTALIHEAYLRLAGKAVDWQNRAHFIGIAAHVMRRVLVDYARAHSAQSRGGKLRRVEFDEGLAVATERSSEVLLVDEALCALEEVHPRQARVVELRYFAGLSTEETAKVLEIAPRSVERDWTQARAWLFERLGKPQQSHSHRQSPGL